jgi:hypothetical protein
MDQFVIPDPDQGTQLEDDLVRARLEKLVLQN